MAIKGKKKGKSAPRRPAGAPRSIQRATQQEAWHSKSSVRLAIGIAAAIILVVVLVLVNNSRDETTALERRQEVIETFTGETQALLQKLSPTATEMVSSSANSKSLARDAARWDRTLTQTQEEVTTTVAATPPELDAANRLIFQAVLQYVAAAKTYALVPEADGELRAKIQERAGAQVAAADGTWLAAISILDQQRTDVELSPTGLRAPSAAAPAPPPTGG